MLLRNHCCRWPLAATAVLLAAGLAHAITGREIVEKADKANRAQDEIVDTLMYIFSPDGHKRVRLMRSYMQAGEGDDDRSLVRFLKPADIKGTGLLTIEEGESDTQWLYLPELRKSKRIAGASKARPFVGSDLSNGDMRTEDLAHHSYRLLGEETVDGRACYKVEARPKDDATRTSYGYARRWIWIDKQRWVPLRVRFFDLGDKPLKELHATDWRQIEGLWRAHRIEIRNLQTGSRTVLVQNPKRKINTGLSRSIFTRRKLEHP